ncbi:MAG TPA: endonuclease/exonuclease/phosphatase family protein, partial [Bacteroidales bacterium]|nr:endonuclease/exonuclease/phosphatase family protein [Bacteroidales bacterium]
PSRKQAEKYFNEILGAISSFNDPDFILFQEVDLASARSYHRNQYEEIALRLGSYAGFFVPNYDVFFVPLPILRPMGKVSSGLALFSSREPDAAEMHAFPGNYAWPKKLFMPDRCFISMAIDLNNGRHLHVINTHNSAFDDGSLRNEQLGILFKHMETLYARGDYVIAGGDWNINPPGFEAGYFASGDKGFNVPFETTVFDRYAHWHIVYDEAFPTNRDVSMPYSPGICNTTILDFYVCSPNISILGINTLYDGFQNTDHQPVLIRFALGPP